MIENTLLAAGLTNETSYEANGSHSISEIIALFDQFGITQGMDTLLSHTQQYAHATRLAPEILHGIDVGHGASDVVQYLMKDQQAREKLGIGELTDQHAAAAMTSGVLHDLPLGFTSQAYTKLTGQDEIGHLITVAAAKTLEGLRYIKGPIGEELPIAAVLQNHGYDLPAETKDLAINELLSAADLETPNQHKGMLNAIAAYKLLDRVWYRGGNVLRGFNELDYLLLDRVNLVLEDEANMPILEEGIEWALAAYTPKEFETNALQFDPDYLKAKIEKKAPGFFQVIEGTNFESYLIEDIAQRNRFERTVNTPIYWKGVELIPTILGVVEGNFPSKFSMQLDELQQRFEHIMTYKP